MTDLSDRIDRLTPAQRELFDRRLRDRARARQATDRVPRRATFGRARLTVDQERIWLVHQFDPDDSSYNLFFALRLRGLLDVDALRRALDAFVQRHEAMRTTFELDGDMPVQVIHDTVTVPIETFDLSAIAEADREAEVLRLATERAKTPFDLVRGPLVRAALLRLTDAEQVLVVTMDHLIFDRASFVVLSRELSELYEAFTTGRQPRLPDIQIHFPDFAEWQRNPAREEVQRRNLTYWKERLQGADTVLELATDRPRPPVLQFRGKRYTHYLPRELSEAIQDLARREEVTVNVVLLAAWKLLLYRLTGQSASIVGTPVSNRDRPELEPVIGYFLTILPLCTRIEPGMTVRELLRAVRSTMTGAVDHADIPFGTLIDELDVVHDPGRSLIYQTSFIMVDFPDETLSMPGLSMEPIILDNGTAKDDICVGYSDERSIGNPCLRGLIEYNSDLFDESTIRRMSAQLARLLEQMVNEPERRVGELSVNGPDEVRGLLAAGTGATVAREDGLRVVDLFRRRAAANPNAPALNWGAGSLSYAELAERAGRLAGYLRRLGAGGRTVVGICLPRCPDLVASMLGVLMAGAAYLPLDPRHPRQRLLAMAEDAGTSLMLTRSDMLEIIGDCPGGRVLLDRDAAAIEGEPVPNDLPDGRGGDLAYVMYTSGSTGRPKGVEVPHHGVTNLVYAMAEEIGLAAGDVVAAISPISFDLSVLEIFGPLAVGAAVVLVEDESRDGRALADLLDRAGVTLLQGTPATMQTLLEAGWRPGGRTRIIVGGEALPGKLAQRLAEQCERVWNLYGVTEAAVWSTAWRVGAGAGEVSIGRPLENCVAYVLDERLQLAAVGVAGDLYLGGIGLARGYRGRAAETARRFVADHLSGSPGGRLYATGDRARLRADGSLVFLGRQDDQVKLRGFRIELGEVVTRIEEQPGVRRAAALVTGAGTDDQHLVAYVEIAGDGPRPEVLRGRLRQWLPDYMIPAAVIALDSFPLNANGKIDRGALPRPSYVPDAVSYVAPRDDVELGVVGVWEEVLGVRPIGIHHRFFDLGGHSLMVLRLIAEIEMRFGVRLPVAAIFQGATPERFADMLRTGYQAPSTAHLVEIAPAAAGSPAFFAHPAGNEVVCYAQLADVLHSADRPLYALASPRATGDRLPFASFEERAAVFAELIRARQPSGPYLLVGWSYGGLNAYSVGQELERAGRRVRLVMIDTPPPDAIDALGAADRTEIVQAIAMSLLSDGRPGKHAEELRAMDDEEHLDYLLGLARAGNLPPDTGRAQIAGVFAQWHTNLRLLRGYRPAPLRDGAVLIRASDQANDPSPGWRELLGDRLEVYEVPGDHYTAMRTPLVDAVADVIDGVWRRG